MLFFLHPDSLSWRRRYSGFSLFFFGVLPRCLSTNTLVLRQGEGEIHLSQIKGWKAWTKQSRCWLFDLCLFDLLRPMLWLYHQRLLGSTELPLNSNNACITCTLQNGFKRETLHCERCGGKWGENEKKFIYQYDLDKATINRRHSHVSLRTPGVARLG